MNRIALPVFPSRETSGRTMTNIPRDRAIDGTLAVLREGYGFAPRRFRRLGTDVFRTRMMLRTAYFVQGAEAAEVFYRPDRLTRRKAMPVPTIKMLQDFGSVQTLTGPDHRHRKRMFMRLMGDAAIDRLLALADEAWHAAATRWPSEVALLPAAQGVLCRAGCRWAGLTLSEEEAERRTREFAAEVTGAGNVGVADWVRGEALRTRNERWARDVVEAVRGGRLTPGPNDAANVIAKHRDRHGALLPVKIAAVELINVLRPLVAVAHFVVHAALALHRHADWRDRLRGAADARPGADPGADLEAFVQEVRRLAPFFPLIGGRVREPFEWRGHRFRNGDWVLLDIYGTNRDPRVWEAADDFRPERFHGRQIGPWDMVPQGGGSFDEGHRCPGEWITIALMKQAVRFLARDLDYEVPDQDLEVDLARMPAIPASRFVMRLRRPPA
jgi:fatty-acid peroxygenase